MDETWEIEVWEKFEVDKNDIKNGIKNEEDKQIKERKEKEESLLLINELFNEVKPISIKPTIGIELKVPNKITYTDFNKNIKFIKKKNDNIKFKNK